MATSKEFHENLMNSLLEIGASSRAMMGEYVLYFNGKVVGGIYDNHVLIKPVENAKKMLKDAEMIVPYAGAKPLIFVENPEDKEFMFKLFSAMYDELPDPKPRKKLLKN